MKGSTPVAVRENVTGFISSFEDGCATATQSQEKPSPTGKVVRVLYEYSYDTFAASDQPMMTWIDDALSMIRWTRVDGRTMLTG